MRTLMLLPVLAWALAACEDHSSPHAGPTAHAARVTSEAQLLAGRTARGRVGDWKIWNDRVAFVIQDVGLASGYQRYGGMPIDADVVRPAGQPGATQLGALFFGFDQRVFEPLAAEVVADGADGGRALVRVTGRDALFDWLDAFMADVLPMASIDCDLVYEYSLGPEDEALRIDVTLRNRADRDRVIENVEAAFIMGDGLQSYFEGPGFDTDEHSGVYPEWLGLGDRVAYGLLADDGWLRMFINYENVAIGSYPSATVPASGELTFTRHLAVSGGGLDRVQAILRRVRADSDPDAAEAVGTLRGRVIADGEAFARGVRLHVRDEEGEHRSLIRPDGAGWFEAELPPGRYLLLAKADGFAPSPEVAVEVAAAEVATASLTVPASTRVRFSVADEPGDPLPARVSFFAAGGEPANVLPPLFGEESHQGGAALVVYSGTGEGEGWLPAGDYEAIATRGPEYERDSRTITAAGAPLDLSFTLARPVDSAGTLAGDFHAHGQYSPDSSVAPERRVSTGLGAGLDLLPLTEHDTIRDYGPAVESIAGASARVRAVVASEITTYVYGHFNAWPLTEKPGELNHGGIEWFHTGAPDLLARIRASESHDVVIQVNHPRSASFGGYFSAVGLDIAAGTVDDWASWSEDFDAVEVFNGGCGNGSGEVKLDWYDLLSRGYRVSVSGGSDSHGDRLGTPRVYVPTPHGPADLDPAELVGAFTAQRVYVSCGPVVDFTVGGRGLGETLAAAPGVITAHARVQAPSWMQLAELRVVRNGEVAWSRPAAEWTGGAGAVRFDADIPVAVDRDAWLVLEVVGAGSLWPIDGGAPYALTNPIYVDVDGDGEYAPLRPRYRPATE